MSVVGPKTSPLATLRNLRPACEALSRCAGTRADTTAVSLNGECHETGESRGMSMRRRRKSTPPPVVPKAAITRVAQDASHPSAIPYLAGSASETVVDALIDEPSAWQRSADGSFYYGNTERTFVSIGDPRVPAAVNAEEAWNLVIQVGGDEAAQSLLYVMARCLSNENPLEKVRIHVNESLTFRGLKRHKSGDFRPEQKRAEARRFRLLSDIWVTARDVVEIRSGRINVTSRLIEVAVESEEEVRSRNPGGPIRLPAIVSSDGTDVPYAVRAGIGDWAKPYIETPDAVKRMLHKIVQYDVNTEAQRFAMRFSLAIMFRRVAESITIGDLLQSARLPIPERRADRFKESVEDAFELLTRDGLIGGWRYENDDDDLPQTRWVNKWLAWTVVLQPNPTALTA